MLDWFARRLKEAQEKDKTGQGGFTLIELLVVVIIIGILAAIAIPTFLGQRERARDAAAVANLRNAVTAAETYGVSANPAYNFSGLNNTALTAIEPSVTFVGGAPAADQVGSITGAAAVGGAQRGAYSMTAASQSGTTFTANANGNGQVSYTRTPAGGTAAPFTP